VTRPDRHDLFRSDSDPAEAEPQPVEPDPSYEGRVDSIICDDVPPTEKTFKNMQRRDRRIT
jgi:hypothetical protein